MWFCFAALRSCLRQLVDLVKSDFADSELFSDKMPPKGNLRFSIAPQTEAETFEKWFADSKVVDENGDPISRTVRNENAIDHRFPVDYG